VVGGVVQQTGFFGGLVSSRIGRHGGVSFSRLGGECLMSMSSLPIDVNLVGAPVVVAELREQGVH